MCYYGSHYEGVALLATFLHNALVDGNLARYAREGCVGGRVPSGSDHLTHLKGRGLL